MRALIMASASFDTVMVPSSTCATKSLIRFFPRSLAAGSRASRPSCTIWSSRLPSTVSPAAGCPTVAFCGSLIAALLQTQLRPELGQFVLVGDGVAQHLFQFVVALHAAAQVGKPIPEFQQLAQRFH